MNIGMDGKTRLAMAAAAGAAGAVGLDGVLENYYHVECRDKDGNLKWTDDFANLVTTAGKNDALTQYFKGSAYTAGWFVGLTSASPTVNVADTAASHTGWTEVIAYSETGRQTLTLGAVASGSADNTASKAVFTVNANGTGIGGAFLINNSTKSGTTGTLYGIGPFAGGDKLLSSGDTLTITLTVTLS